MESSLATPSPAPPPPPPSPSPSQSRPPLRRWLGSLPTPSTPACWLQGTVEALDLLQTKVLTTPEDYKHLIIFCCFSQTRFFNFAWLEFYLPVQSWRLVDETKLYVLGKEFEATVCIITLQGGTTKKEGTIKTSANGACMGE